MSSIAARPRQGLLWLVQAIVRSGATFPRRTGGGTTQGWRRRRPHRFSEPYLAAHYRPGPRGRSHCGVDDTRTTGLPEKRYKAGISSHQQVEPHLRQTMHRYTLIGKVGWVGAGRIWAAQPRRRLGR